MTDRPATDRPAPGRLIDVGGYRLHVVDEGSGPPLMLMAALGSNWFDLDPLAARLRDRWRVIRYDRPGYGLSGRLIRGRPHTLAGEVHRMVGVLDELGVTEPVTIAAHSMASLYAEGFARTHPTRTAGVLMLDGSFVLAPWRLVPTGFRVGNAHRLIGLAEAVGTRLGVRRRGTNVFRGRFLPAPPEGFDEHQQYWTRRVFGSPQMLLALLAENAAFPRINGDLRRWRRRRPMPPPADCPVVVVVALPGPRPWNEFWLWKQQRYADVLGGRVAKIEPAHHFVVLDRPDDVAAIIDEVRPAY
ncbi:alpha/beta hydrolase [Gordonia soli]|uniref:Putative hydrolase n=1 Tax=Gordonia soli NBRC 108243 TaxID=1223545 RepID=M0QLV0_9ACTN|nr:alpha/beta hydrolase [Gordonia soli]GAC69286.1 putative hydrolase [Gordonia soli NBRC 108243]